MDKKYTLKVSASDLMVLKSAIDKIQIYGKDAVIVADIYSKILDALSRSEADSQRTSTESE